MTKFLLLMQSIEIILFDDKVSYKYFSIDVRGCSLAFDENIVDFLS